RGGVTRRDVPRGPFLSAPAVVGGMVFYKLPLSQTTNQGKPDIVEGSRRGSATAEQPRTARRTAVWNTGEAGRRARNASGPQNHRPNATPPRPAQTPLRASQRALGAFSSPKLSPCPLPFRASTRI